MKGKVLIFDIWGDLGHFRKFFTTSSPLTYPCPPPTTIRGIIGAILGLGKNEYISITNAFDVGVRILNPVKKIKMGMNYVDTKSSSVSGSYLEIENRTQVYLEFVKNPKYRVYVRSKDEDRFEWLKTMLENGQTHYSVSLGLAYLLGSIQFIGEGEFENKGEVDYVDTLFTSDCLIRLEISGLKMSKDRMLMYMEEGRKPGEYKDTIVEISGNRIKGKFKNISVVSCSGGEDYVFFFTVTS